MHHSHTKTVFTDLQLEKLQAVFDQDSTPGTSVKRYLAQDLGLKAKAVQVWFNNRACRGKKRGERLISRNVSCISQLKYSPVRLGKNKKYEKEMLDTRSSSNTPNGITFKNENYYEGKFKAQNPDFNITLQKETVPYEVNRMDTLEYHNLKQQALANIFGTYNDQPQLLRSFQATPDQDFHNFNFFKQLFPTKS
ncbi:hypothetical protein K502DRAFT_342662 [Neoconidiobolus thromboides FSU 785]|nr:hypothetical protein K502DRAFT_342662 [Neoconidiobolus thromboides FSU 785]